MFYPVLLAALLFGSLQTIAQPTKYPTPPVPEVESCNYYEILKKSKVKEVVLKEYNINNRLASIRTIRYNEAGQTTEFSHQQLLKNMFSKQINVFDEAGNWKEQRVYENGRLMKKESWKKSTLVREEDRVLEFLTTNLEGKKTVMS